MAVAGAAIVSMLSLPACGGGEDTSTSGAASHFSQISQMVPRSQFINDSHDLCKKWKVKINRGLKNLYRQRAQETGEPEGNVGAIEAMRVVIVPSMDLEVKDFEAVGLPKGEAYAAEAMWQEVRNIARKVENEGIVAWTRESLLDRYRVAAKPFQLQNCLYF
ncbi:MAG TPA: hypothetical protein VFP21_01845 [Solirubrobacterales bacterium]|nr:hypothetical protein [Solirubrobacterales bacterium]